MSEKMSIEEYKEKMEELFDECEKVLAQFKGDKLAELKESKKEGKWKPNLMDEYWIRDECGNIEPTRWDNDRIDNWRYNNILIFPTEEECERYWHFMDTVKEKSYEFTTNDWKNSNLAKFYIFYGYNTGKFYIDSTNISRGFGTTYFRSCKDAQYIIDNFKDELMEYWI